MTIIKFKDIESGLGTRQSGAKVRARIEALLKASDTLTFDFDRVEVISNSFADECFAKLLFSFDLDFIKKHTTFVNANPFVKTVISGSLKQRVQLVSI